VACLDTHHLKAWQAAAAMMPKPQMIKYHEAFLKGNNWLHHQCTNIGDYKKKKAGTKFWDNKEDQYVNILNALGVDYVPRP
jgi:hypothetical protein